MAPGRGRRQLDLIGGFELRIGGRPVAVPPTAQRLIAYLGLQDRQVLRPRVAGTLWIDNSDRNALANLRSVLWRLPRTVRIVDAIGDRLALARDLEVDVRLVTQQARSILRGGAEADPRALTLLGAAELLPDWYDDWVLIERERFRQLRLHALERMCLDLTRAGDHAAAVEAGLMAVAEEPLRESAHRALIAAHLSEGNASEALRQYRRYEAMMRSELGLDPSEMMELLVRQIRAVTRPTEGRIMPAPVMT